MIKVNNELREIKLPDSIASTVEKIKENFDSLLSDIKIQHIFRYSLIYIKLNLNNS